MDKKSFIESGLLEQYVLGITTPDETEEVERHLEAFPELKEEVSGMRQALDQYAKQYAVDPPNNLRGRILRDIDEISGDSNTPTRSRSLFSGNAGNWLKGLGVAALLGLSLGCLLLNSKLQNAKNNLSAVQNDLISCEDERSMLSQRADVVAFLSKAGTRSINLKSKGDLMPGAYSMAFWNANARRCLINSNGLPALDDKEQYQVWADVAGKMISIGLLEKDREAFQQLNYLADAESLNITIEPKGGSEEPTVSKLIAYAKL